MSGQAPNGRRATHYLAGFAAGLAAIPLTSQADDLVFMQGVSATISSNQQRVDAARDRLCTMDGLRAVSETMGAVDDRLAPLLGALGADPGVLDELEFDAADLYNRFCGAGTPVDLRAFRIIYAECRMTMHDGRAAFDLRIPPGQGSAVFNLIDYAGRQVVTQPIDISGVLGGQVASGNASSGSLTGPNGTRRYVTDDLDVTVSEYGFDSSFRVDVTAMLQAFAGTQQPSPQQLQMLNQVMGQPIITSSGTAWVTTAVDGLDTVRKFYENFAAVIDSGQGSSALMAGLFNHYVLDKGLPLEIETTTDMKMASAAAGLGAFAPNILQMPGGSTTRTAIDSVLVTPMPEGYCEANAIPDGFAVVDPTAGLNPGTQPTSSTTPGGGAGPGAPAGAAGSPGAFVGGAGGPGAPGGGAAAGGPGGAIPPDAAGQIADALGQLTPEQQQALAGFGAGFGQLLGGLAGNEAAVAAGANGAGAAGGAANAQQSQALQDVGAGLAGILNAFDQGQGNVQVRPGGAQGAGAAAPAAARPSSASLMTGNLTESVQNMLRALGYDPGASNGQLSTQTIVAISQFQAEKGLEVTGEVTPQLVGILAAEVDKP